MDKYDMAEKAYKRGYGDGIRSGELKAKLDYKFKKPKEVIPEELLAQMNYQSPIAVNIANDIQLKMEDNIMTAIYSYGVEVDKDELLKALAYDRDQYATGYADGVRAARQPMPELYSEVEEMCEEAYRECAEKNLEECGACPQQYELGGRVCKVSLINELWRRWHNAMKERDVAIADLRRAEDCRCCAYGEGKYGSNSDICNSCISDSRWKWRGAND